MIIKMFHKKINAIREKGKYKGERLTKKNYIFFPGVIL